MEMTMEWVPVSQRLPELRCETFEDLDGGCYPYEISDWVLGIDRIGEINVVYYETGPLWTGWLDRHHRALGITHWMSLPKPPKEVGHG